MANEVFTLAVAEARQVKDTQAQGRFSTFRDVVRSSLPNVDTDVVRAAIESFPTHSGWDWEQRTRDELFSLLHREDTRRSDSSK